MTLLKKFHSPIYWPKVKSISRTRPPSWNYDLLSFAIMPVLPDEYTITYNIDISDWNPEFQTPTN